MQDADTRRMHERVRRYWAGIKENRKFPREEEIDPAVLADVWDYCFLVDMRKSHVDNTFKYQFMGKELIAAYGANMTGMKFSGEDPAPHVTSMISHFDEVAESGEQAMYDSDFMNERDTRIKYRCCLLPVGRERVELILGCMRWKAV